LAKTGWIGLYVYGGISDCNACVNACPFDAIQIYWDKEAYESYLFVGLLKCNGCGACEANCPTGGIKAIKVWKKTNQNVLESAFSP
jgi:formate hydrogenlyase subunit 6/NADH:ubiquinone oxidoreductase subunit I